MKSIGDWVEVERECIRRFNQRAAELRAANPQLSEAEAFCRAVEQLKETAARYQDARHALLQVFIPSLPLHDW
jgi:hypothetical protein